jgi:hypothetical protein
MRCDTPHPAARIDFLLPLRSSSRADGRSVPIGRSVTRATKCTHIDILQLAFETKHLRTLCESSADAISELGQDVARDLMERLADLDSAVSIKDVLSGQPRPSDDGDLLIELVSGYRLQCRANHPNNPKTATNAIDWAKVSRIKIVGIANS